MNAHQVSSFTKAAIQASPSSQSLGEGAPRNLSFGGNGSQRGLTVSNLVTSFQQVREVANCQTYVAIIVAMMGALMFGIDQGNYGLAAEFPSFYDFWCKPHFLIDDYPCTPGVHTGIATPGGWLLFKSLGGSLITLGAAAGCMFLGPLITSNCGRRLCVSTGGIVSFIGCLFASYMTFGNVIIYYIGRFVTGFGAGVCCFALPLYSSEMSTPSIRGLMGSIFQLMVVTGGLFASVCLSLIEDWRLGMLLPGLAGGVVGVLIWFTPESPRYVMDKHGYDAGVAILQKVRKGDVEREAQAMKLQSEAEAEAGSVSYRQLFEHSGLRRRVFVACYLQIAQQATGVNAFLSYTTNIFEAAGIPLNQINSMPGYAIYFNILMLVGVIAGLVCVDSPYGGRRSQLLSASFVMGPPLVVAGVAQLQGWPGWIAVVALALYGPGFQFAWGMMPWVYPAEIFAMNEKDKAVSLATFLQFAFNFVVNLITPTLLDLSSGGTFVFFGLLNVSNIVFVYLCIKETKGIPLEAIPALFDKEKLLGTSGN